MISLFRGGARTIAESTCAALVADLGPAAPPGGGCADLVVEDPGPAVRARARAVLADPGDLHDPESVSAAYLVAAAILQL